MVWLLASNFLCSQKKFLFLFLFLFLSVPVLVLVLVLLALVAAAATAVAVIVDPFLIGEESLAVRLLCACSPLG